MARPRTPTSTYRLQISPEFPLARAAELAGYLSDLGVSHLYASPLLRATAGSAHGYDWVDATEVDPQRGGEPGRQLLLAALREHRLGLVVDIVPNHCGVAVPEQNPAWWDVLRMGGVSRYSHWFDIDWSRGKVVLPVLGDEPDPLASVTLDGDVLRYGELALPVAPDTGAGSALEVLDRQHYTLVRGAAGNSEVSYRRFFAVSTLAGLRVEEPAVFDGVHRLVLRWAADGECDGIRADHPDGLADPTTYLARLRSAVPTGTWVIVEKILEPGERLPETWACAGTTGYDALREIGGVFLDPAGEEPFTALDTELSGRLTDWAELRHACKLDVITGMLRAELARLAALAPEVDRAGDALAELLACFDVYRTYLPAAAERLEDAMTEAVRRRPDLAEPLAQLGVRLGTPGDELAVRLQQTSGGVMAKGVEDTALYRWTRFAALNEVGGDPALFGLSPQEFHAANAARQDRWPAGMTTLSTHDTKRCEDVRARMAVLAEIPDEWAAAVRRWAQYAPGVDGSFAHLIWQTAVGAWPIERDRLRDYCDKAMREAREHTSWEHPDEAYEKAVHAGVDRLYDDPTLHADVTAFAERVRGYGWTNSLGFKLVQLTMPGVPDVYQGSELWDNSLVDPDNRRPVDFAARRALLARLDAGTIGARLDAAGTAKLLVTSRALRTRRDRPSSFTTYRPVVATGPAAEHLVAFDRGGALAAVTRLPVGLDRRGGWEGTVLDLPAGQWVDVLTGTPHAGAVPVAALLADLPVALLVSA